MIFFMFKITNGKGRQFLSRSEALAITVISDLRSKAAVLFTNQSGWHTSVLCHTEQADDNKVHSNLVSETGFYMSICR